jgi:hypothetical protein
MPPANAGVVPENKNRKEATSAFSGKGSLSVILPTVIAPTLHIHIAQVNSNELEPIAKLRWRVSIRALRKHMRQLSWLPETIYERLRGCLTTTDK